MPNIKIYTLAIVFMVGPLSAYSQLKIDSLENVLKKNISDTNRVRTLLKLAEAYEYVDGEKSRVSTENAIKLIEQKSLDELKADAYQRLGSNFRVSGDFRSALKADNTALESSILLNDSLGISKSFNNVAHDYYDLGEYDEAYHYFIQAYKVARKIDDTLTMAVALHNLGRVFKELQQYDNALEHIKLSRKLSREINDREGEPYSLGELGDVFLRRGSYDSALFTLLDALKQSRELGLRVLEPRTMLNIAQVYEAKENHKNAFAYYDTALIAFTRTNNRYGIAEVKLGRGITQLNLGNHEEALTSIQASLGLAKELNANILEIQCYQHLSRLWEVKGDYKQSLQYYKEYKLLEDTLFSQEVQSKLMRDQLRFETESLDSQIAVLNLQQEQQRSALKREQFVRNILVVVMALSGILLLTVYRSGQRRRKINTLLLQHQEDMEKRSDELERLNQVKDKFFSIISHDLRSPINALSGLLDLIDKGAVTADELPLHIRELRVRFNHTRTLLNNLLDWTLLQMDKLNLSPSKIDLAKIVDENILLLGPVQGKDIQIQNEVPKPAIGYGDSNTINLVIRNLLTNALKFTNDGGEVVIKAKEENDEWHVSVKDNGIGMKPEVLKILFDKTAPYTTRGTANEKGTGLGLILCKEFIEKNGGRIWVESVEGQGSAFYFTIPKGS